MNTIRVTSPPPAARYSARGFRQQERSPMKGDAKVIEYLNKALYNELTAIN